MRISCSSGSREPSGRHFPLPLTFFKKAMTCSRTALRSSRMKVNTEFGTIEPGDPSNGDVPSVVPPKGPSFPATSPTTAPQTGQASP